MKYRYRHRLISIIICLSFILQTIGWTAPTTNYNIGAISTQTSLPLNVINISNIHIPEQYGRIENTKYENRAPGISPKQPLIVLIKDAHCNYEAQQNIAKIIESLINNYNVDLVAIEGAAGTLDLSKFGNFPDNKEKERIITKYVKQGYIPGPEFLNITKYHSLPFNIYGMENEKLYIENLSAFRQTWQNRTITEKFIQKISTVLQTLKDKIYSPNLLNFDSKEHQYKNNELSLTEWTKFLEEHCTLYRVQCTDNEKYRNFNLIRNSISIEKQLDLNKVEQERERLIRYLQKQLPKEELEQLVRISLQFKSGKIPTLAFYEYLENLIRTDSEAPTLDSLTNYISLLEIQSQISTNQLFTELDLITNEIKSHLFQNKQQQKLDKLTKHINILKKLYRLELNREELEYYNKNKDKFTTKQLLAISKTIVSSKKTPLPHTLSNTSFFEKVDASLIPATNFYKLALERDRALVANVIDKMTKENTKKAIMVCGGFHALGITEILENKDINYVVVTPKITKEQTNNPYLSLMLDEKINCQLPIESSHALAIPELVAPKGNKLRPHVQEMAAPLQASVLGELQKVIAMAEDTDPTALSGHVKRTIEPLTETDPGSINVTDLASLEKQAERITDPEKQPVIARLIELARRLVIQEEETTSEPPDATTDEDGFRVYDPVPVPFDPDDPTQTGRRQGDTVEITSGFRTGADTRGGRAKTGEPSPRAHAETMVHTDTRRILLDAIKVAATDPDVSLDFIIDELLQDINNDQLKVAFRNVFGALKGNTVNLATYAKSSYYLWHYLRNYHIVFYSRHPDQYLIGTLHSFVPIGYSHPQSKSTQPEFERIAFINPIAVKSGINQMPLGLCPPNVNEVYVIRHGDHMPSDTSPQARIVAQAEQVFTTLHEVHHKLEKIFMLHAYNPFIFSDEREYTANLAATRATAYYYGNNIIFSFFVRWLFNLWIEVLLWHDKTEDMRQAPAHISGFEKLVIGYLAHRDIPELRAYLRQLKELKEKLTALNQANEDQELRQKLFAELKELFLNFGKLLQAHYEGPEEHNMTELLTRTQDLLDHFYYTEHIGDIDPAFIDTQAYDRVLDQVISYITPEGQVAESTETLRDQLKTYRAQRPESAQETYCPETYQDRTLDHHITKVTSYDADNEIPQSANPFDFDIHHPVAAPIPQGDLTEPDLEKYLSYLEHLADKEEATTINRYLEQLLGPECFAACEGTPIPEAVRTLRQVANDLNDPLIVSTSPETDEVYKTIYRRMKNKFGFTEESCGPFDGIDKFGWQDSCQKIEAEITITEETDLLEKHAALYVIRAINDLGLTEIIQDNVTNISCGSYEDLRLIPELAPGQTAPVVEYFAASGDLLIYTDRAKNITRHALLAEIERVLRPSQDSTPTAEVTAVPPQPEAIGRYEIHSVTHHNTHIDVQAFPADKTDDQIAAAADGSRGQRATVPPGTPVHHIDPINMNLPLEQDLDVISHFRIREVIRELESWYRKIESAPDGLRTITAARTTLRRVIVNLISFYLRERDDELDAALRLWLEDLQQELGLELLEQAPWQLHALTEGGDAAEYNIGGLANGSNIYLISSLAEANIAELAMAVFHECAHTLPEGFGHVTLRRDHQQRINARTNEKLTHWLRKRKIDNHADLIVSAGIQEQELVDYVLKPRSVHNERLNTILSRSNFITQNEIIMKALCNLRDVRSDISDIVALTAYTKLSNEPFPPVDRTDERKQLFLHFFSYLTAVPKVTAYLTGEEDPTLNEFETELLFNIEIEQSSADNTAEEIYAAGRVELLRQGSGSPFNIITANLGDTWEIEIETAQDLSTSSPEDNEEQITICNRKGKFLISCQNESHFIGANESQNLVFSLGDHTLLLTIDEAHNISVTNLSQQRLELIVKGLPQAVAVSGEMDSDPTPIPPPELLTSQQPRTPPAPPRLIGKYLVEKIIPPDRLTKRQRKIAQMIGQLPKPQIKLAAINLDTGRREIVHLSAEEMKTSDRQRLRERMARIKDALVKKHQHLQIELNNIFHEIDKKLSQQDFKLYVLDDSDYGIDGIGDSHFMAVSASIASMDRFIVGYLHEALESAMTSRDNMSVNNSLLAEIEETLLRPRRDYVDDKVHEYGELLDTEYYSNHQIPDRLKTPQIRTLHQFMLRAHYTIRAFTKEYLPEDDTQLSEQLKTNQEIIAARQARMPRTVAHGDVHAYLDELKENLRRARLITGPAGGEYWCGGENHLIMVGDYFHRGPESAATIHFLLDLQQQARAAGGDIVLILGNHEENQLKRIFGDGESLEESEELRLLVLDSVLSDSQNLRLAFLLGEEFGLEGSDRILFSHAGLRTAIENAVAQELAQEYGGHPDEYTLDQITARMNQTLQAEVPKCFAIDEFLKNQIAAERKCTPEEVTPQEVFSGHMRIFAALNIVATVLAQERGNDFHSGNITTEEIMSNTNRILTLAQANNSGLRTTIEAILTKRKEKEAKRKGIAPETVTEEDIDDYVYNLEALIYSTQADLNAASAQGVYIDLRQERFFSGAVFNISTARGGSAGVGGILWAGFGEHMQSICIDPAQKEKRRPRREGLGHSPKGAAPGQFQVAKGYFNIDPGMALSNGVKHSLLVLDKNQIRLEVKVDGQWEVVVLDTLCRTREQDEPTRVVKLPADTQQDPSTTAPSISRHDNRAILWGAVLVTDPEERQAYDPHADIEANLDNFISQLNSLAAEGQSWYFHSQLRIFFNGEDEEFYEAIEQIERERSLEEAAQLIQRVAAVFKDPRRPYSNKPGAVIDRKIHQAFINRFGFDSELGELSSEESTLIPKTAARCMQNEVHADYPNYEGKKPDPTELRLLTYGFQTCNLLLEKLDRDRIGLPKRSIRIAYLQETPPSNGYRVTSVNSEQNTIYIYANARNSSRHNLIMNIANSLGELIFTQYWREHQADPSALTHLLPHLNAIRSMQPTKNSNPFSLDEPQRIIHYLTLEFTRFLIFETQYKDNGETYLNRLLDMKMWQPFENDWRTLITFFQQFLDLEIELDVEDLEEETPEVQPQDTPDSPSPNDPSPGDRSPTQPDRTSTAGAETTDPDLGSTPQAGSKPKPAATPPVSPGGTPLTPPENEVLPWDTYRLQEISKPCLFEHWKRLRQAYLDTTAVNDKNILAEIINNILKTTLSETTLQQLQEIATNQHPEEPQQQTVLQIDTLIKIAEDLNTSNCYYYEMDKKFYRFRMLQEEPQEINHLAYTIYRELEQRYGFSAQTPIIPSILQRQLETCSQMNIALQCYRPLEKQTDTVDLNYVLNSLHSTPELQLVIWHTINASATTHIGNFTKPNTKIIFNATDEVIGQDVNIINGIVGYDKTRNELYIFNNAKNTMRDTFNRCFLLGLRLLWQIPDPEIICGADIGSEQIRHSKSENRVYVSQHYFTNLRDPLNMSEEQLKKRFYWSFVQNHRARHDYIPAPIIPLTATVPVPSQQQTAARSKTIIGIGHAIDPLQEAASGQETSLPEEIVTEVRAILNMDNNYQAQTGLLRHWQTTASYLDLALRTGVEVGIYYPTSMPNDPTTIDINYDQVPDTVITPSTVYQRGINQPEAMGRYEIIKTEKSTNKTALIVDARPLPMTEEAEDTLKEPITARLNFTTADPVDDLEIPIVINTLKTWLNEIPNGGRFEYADSRQALLRVTRELISYWLSIKEDSENLDDVADRDLLLKMLTDLDDSYGPSAATTSSWRIYTFDDRDDAAFYNIAGLTRKEEDTNEVLLVASLTDADIDIRAMAIFHEFAHALGYTHQDLYQRDDGECIQKDISQSVNQELTDWLWERKTNNIARLLSDYEIPLATVREFITDYDNFDTSNKDYVNLENLLSRTSKRTQEAILEKLSQDETEQQPASGPERVVTIEYPIDSGSVLIITPPQDIGTTAAPQITLGFINDNRVAIHILENEYHLYCNGTNINGSRSESGRVSFNEQGQITNTANNSFTFLISNTRIRISNKLQSPVTISIPLNWESQFDTPTTIRGIIIPLSRDLQEAIVAVAANLGISPRELEEIAGKEALAEIDKNSDIDNRLALRIISLMKADNNEIDDDEIELLLESYEAVIPQLSRVREIVARHSPNAAGQTAILDRLAFYITTLKFQQRISQLQQFHQLPDFMQELYRKMTMQSHLHREQIQALLLELFYMDVEFARDEQGELTGPLTAFELHLYNLLVICDPEDGELQSLCQEFFRYKQIQAQVTQALELAPDDIRGETTLGNIAVLLDNYLRHRKNKKLTANIIIQHISGQLTLPAAESSQIQRIINRSDELRIITTSNLRLVKYTELFEFVSQIFTDREAKECVLYRIPANSATMTYFIIDDGRKVIAKNRDILADQTCLFLAQPRTGYRLSNHIFYSAEELVERVTTDQAQIPENLAFLPLVTPADIHLSRNTNEDIYGSL